MRVMVVGSTGNVGSALVQRLHRAPGFEDVVGASRRDPGSGARDWRQLDLSVGVPDGFFTGLDAVVHLAWLFQPTRSPATTWSANVEGTARLFEAVARSDVGVLVHASSVGAYSPRRSDDLVDESWPTHGIPTAAYSREKAYVERLLDRFEAEHPRVRVVRLRPAFTFREEASVQQRRLFLGPFVPMRPIGRALIPALPDPGLTLQAVHTDDVVRAYELALTRDVTGAFNIASEPVLDMPAIGRLLDARVGRIPRGLTRKAVAAAWAAHLIPASPGLFDLMMQVPLMDTSRARSLLGWQPEHSAQDALESLLAGFRSGAGAPTPPLDPATSGRWRSHEIATGVGRRP